MASTEADDAPLPDGPLPDGPLFVGLDGGYVRGRDQGWFEVVAGNSAASFHRDGRDRDPAGRCLALVQTVDERPRARLVDTLRRQGLRPEQPVIFLSDGAATLRRLQRNLVPEPEHVLDGFPRSPRPWPRSRPTSPTTPTTSSAAGNASEAASGSPPASWSPRSAVIDKRTDKRFDERQPARWTPHGGHVLLQTRTRVLNGDLDDRIRCRYPAFRMPTGAEAAPVL